MCGITGWVNLQQSNLRDHNETILHSMRERIVHRGPDSASTTVSLMKPHRPRVSAWQQAAAHEDAQQALPQPRLHLSDGGGIEPSGGMEDDHACGGRVEHAVDDDTVEVQVGIEAGAE